MSDKAFDFNKFIEETRAVLLTPAGYFASMQKSGGLAEPLIKAVIYGTVAGIINLIWAALNFSAAAGMMGGMFGGGIGVAGLIMSIIGSIIVLFLGGAILLVISAICGGSTDYESNVRVTASIMALSPAGALFGFLSGFSLTLGGLVSIAISLYGIWMLYNALTRALGAKDGAAKVISIILAVIPVLMILSALLCVKAAKNMPGQMMKEMNIPAEDQKKLQESMQKLLEEAAKQSKQN